MSSSNVSLLLLCKERCVLWCMTRVGQNHTFIGIYGVYTVFLARKSPYIRSYTVCIYNSGQPYTSLCASYSA